MKIACINRMFPGAYEICKYEKNFIESLNHCYAVDTVDACSISKLDQYDMIFMSFYYCDSLCSNDIEMHDAIVSANKPMIVIAKTSNCTLLKSFTSDAKDVKVFVQHRYDGDMTESIGIPSMYISMRKVNFARKCVDIAYCNKLLHDDDFSKKLKYSGFTDMILQDFPPYSLENDMIGNAICAIAHYEDSDADVITPLFLQASLDGCLVFVNRKSEPERILLTKKYQYSSAGECIRKIHDFKDLYASNRLQYVDEVLIQRKRILQYYKMISHSFKKQMLDALMSS